MEIKKYAQKTYPVISSISPNASVNLSALVDSIPILISISRLPSIILHFENLSAELIESIVSPGHFFGQKSTHSIQECGFVGSEKFKKKQESLSKLYYCQ